MQHFGHYIKAESLHEFGIEDANNIYWNLTTPELYAEALRRNEAEIAHKGPLVVNTGRYTGRSPKDKFVVRDSMTDEHVDWGEVNQPMSADHFSVFEKEMLAATAGKDLFVQDMFV
ncbi:MAG: phosphoenolpyruvate carboxykinase (ATP), partial [Deinococcota bacterium]